MAVLNGMSRFHLASRRSISNWQSDALGRGLMIIVSAYLLYRGSAQSREGMDRIEAAVRRVQRALHARQETQPDGSTLEVESRPAAGRSQGAGIWKRYGLGIAFAALFLVSWVLQTWSGWSYFVGEQLQHHSPADVFGSSGYIWLWGQDTFSNWQSDLLWDGIVVLLAARFIFQGSEESRESDDRIEQLASSIEGQVRGQAPAQEAQQETNRHVTGNFWYDRGLALALIAAGIAAWALMTWTGWMNFAADQQQHGSSATLFGASGYIWDWARMTLENWQSDILGNLATVVLSAYVLYKGSSVSRDSGDEIEQALQRIQGMLRQGGQSEARVREKGRSAAE